MAQIAAQTLEHDLPFLKSPAIHRRYDNGYQLVFVRKPGEVFNLNTWVRTGSINEDDVNNGVSHFLEHLMFKGTERFKPGEFDRAMEGMGAIINAATWKDFTFYYITGPKGDQGKNFEHALDMHADMLLCSTLPDAEIGPAYDHTDPDPTLVKRERAVVIEEIGMRGDQPWTKVFNGVNHLMYPERHPYRRDVIGTRDIISQIPRESIETYYHRWYSAPAMTTIVVGDFDFEWLEAKVLKHFNFEGARLAKEVDTTALYDADVDTQALTKADHIELGDVQTAFMMMGFHGPRAANVKESVAIDLFLNVFGDGKSSRLNQVFIEKPDAPVFNYISAGQSKYRLGNVTYVQGNLNISSAEEAQAQKAAVLAELASMLNDRPLQQDEFERARKMLKNQFAETSESASGIAEEIGESFTLTDGISAYADYLGVLEALTCAQVQAIAQRWLQPQQAHFAVLLPQAAA